MKQLKNVAILEGNDVWELREVNVNSVNIVKDQSLQYQLIPTNDHNFMNKIGFSKYIYNAWIKKVEKLEDGSVQLYDYNLFPSVKVKLSDEELNEWKEMDSFIEFV